MADLTREEVEEWMRGSHPESAVAIVGRMALRAIDAGWQPMETAPSGGELRWLTIEYDDGRRAVVRSVTPLTGSVAWMPYHFPPPFTGDAKAAATEPGECAECEGSGFANVLLTSYPPQRVRCLVCNGTGKRKGGEHG